MDPIFVGKAITTETSGNVVLLPKYGNRHGLSLAPPAPARR